MSKGARHTLIVGAGMTGLSVLRHLHGQDTLTLVDTRAGVVPDAERAQYPNVRYLLGVDQNAVRAELDAHAQSVDRAVVSPGLEDGHWLLQYLDARAIPQCTDIDLFFTACDPAAAVVGVTGTNGKSTVTDLTAKLLGALGVRACAGGNLGPAALDLLSQQAQAYVLELSSFQLARSAPGTFAVAAILNVQPDHLDYHGSMTAYLAAKQRIYAAAKCAVFSRDDAATVPAEAVAQQWSFGLDAPAPGQTGITQRGQRQLLAAASKLTTSPVAIVDRALLPLAGRHNERNALAALALVLALQPAVLEAVDGQPNPMIDALAQALADYRGLPHRCEPVAHIEGVGYINDSKATNVGATVAAIEGLRSEQGQLLLLLGGDGKGADFAALADVVEQGVRAAFVFGAAAEELERVLSAQVATDRCVTLREALYRAQATAQPGDSVLLSPACASFDQFANFAARGEAFRGWVQELAA